VRHRFTVAAKLPGAMSNDRYSATPTPTARRSSPASWLGGPPPVLDA
jgi:hypothetical protein